MIHKHILNILLCLIYVHCFDTVKTNLNKMCHNKIQNKFLIVLRTDLRYNIFKIHLNCILALFFRFYILPIDSVQTNLAF